MQTKPNKPTTRAKKTDLAAGSVANANAGNRLVGNAASEQAQVVTITLQHGLHGHDGG